MTFSVSTPPPPTGKSSEVLEATEVSQQERSHRRRVLKSALVVFNNRCSTIPCRVRNISSTGAKLEFETGGIVLAPDHFDLLIELDGTDTPCVVVWRRNNEAGVRFIGATQVFKPGRNQVVQCLVPLPPPRLRKSKAGPL